MRRVSHLIAVTMSGIALSYGLAGCGETTGPEDASSARAPTITITPATVDLRPGEGVQFSATTQNQGRNNAVAAPSWKATGGSITPQGHYTAGSRPGRYWVIAISGKNTGRADVRILDSGGTEEEPPVDEDPHSSGDWSRTLADTTIHGDVVVPDGQAWLIGPNVEIEGNLRTVGGTIAMRPGSSLKFLGANPNEYVGGGLTYEEQFANDIGLWIGPQGMLDVQCTPKTSWNRTGVDPTWKPDDEYWIAPTDVDDHQPRRWHPGEPIPQVDPRVPPAEIINVTRDCVIEGPGHIHIHSERPQIIEYVQLRGMGISSLASGGPVMGRYALHLHINGDGSRGTIIQGVAAIESEGVVFVPHASHGVTMIDNVSVNSYAEGLWWDVGDMTNDLLVDRLAVSGVFMPPDIGGGVSRRDGTTLGAGFNMEMRNSAVSGVRDGKIGAGFNWPAKANTSGIPPVWTFQESNVAHNNSGPGIFFWNNTKHPHVVEDAILYRNGASVYDPAHPGNMAPGVLNGAYLNSNRYADMVLLGNRLVQNSNSSEQNIDGGPARYERIWVEVSDGPALEVGDRHLAATSYVEFIDCTFISGSGYPKVYVRSGTNPWLAHFIRSGVEPEDIEFEILTGGADGSHILIDQEDGRRWEIKVEGGKKVVQEL
ncbi:MAG: hypothetical protein ACREMD_16280 [Gemmatimonadota bacterium]